MRREVRGLTDLVLALEQATHMAKQLSNTTDPAQTLQIHSTLHSAHHQLSSFLSQLPLPPPIAAENSIFSAAGGVEENGVEPMQVGDGDEEIEEEHISKTTIDRIEERLRNCFIQNKRPKRPLSPSAVVAAEQRRSYDNEFARGMGLPEFDPHATRLRSLDLICQFHG